jgi:hypothetical protein
MSCGYKTTDLVVACPQCKGKMINSPSMRRTGRIQAIAGGCLVVVMSLILVLVFFDWDLLQPMLVPCALGVAAGLAGIASGAWLIRYGRLNSTLFFLAVVLIVAMVFSLSMARRIGQRGN